MSEFRAWSRSGIHGLGTGTLEAGRHQAEVELKLAPTGGGPNVGGRAKFELMGPLDVDGLVPGTIVTRVPAPGAVDATETRFAHIELTPSDLPWRHTPELPGAQQELKPWIVLVVAEAPEVEFLGERVRLEQAALAHHDLKLSSGWAHVHVLDGETRKLARIVSPRDLEANTDHVAVLVPAFVEAAIPEGLKPAWDGNGPETLRWYDRWTFRTGPKGDFQEIAARIQPTTPAEIGAFGVAEIRHPQAAEPLPMRAALAAIPEPGAAQPDAAPPPPAVAARVHALTEPIELDGRWVLSSPAYDEPWPGPAAPWRAAFRSDPRRRGGAGLGAWAAIGWQERITDAAAAQAGALGAAAQRIRHLTLGLSAARSLWNQRFPEDSDPLGRLAFLGPALARIPASADATVLDHVAGRVPGRLVAELFSSAARRVLRAGPARTAHAQPGAAHLTAVLEVANRCPRPPAPDGLAGGFREAIDRGVHGRGFMQELIARARNRVPEDELEIFDSLIRMAPGWALEGEPVPAPDLISTLEPGGDRPPDLRRLRRVVNELPDSPPFEDPRNAIDELGPVFFGEGGGGPACRPFDDLGQLGTIVAGAVDPNVDRPVVVERVLATIPHGLEEPVLAPPDLSPELDLPLWKFLDERQRDWLLPGVGLLPSDRVTMVQTNPEFVDAFLVGANQQALGELRWRNLPVRTGWTPLRRFWSRFPAPGTRNTDIEGIAGWPADSGLGDRRHRTDPSHGEDLVVVFRTELFRRYPTTLVYLYPADVDAQGRPIWTTTPEPAGRRLYPIFNGSIGPEVTFFGFAASPAEGRTHWVVLEEPPPGFRFAPPAPAGVANGAAFAAATFARPVRVFLGNLL